MHIIGYWPSYNVPFFEKVYNLSGYPAFAAKHGTDFTYQLAPRAKIFRRDQASVKDMDSMKRIMRYNGRSNHFKVLTTEYGLYRTSLIHLFSFSVVPKTGYMYI